MFSGLVNYIWGTTEEPVKQEEPSDVAAFYKLNKNTGNWDCHFLEAKVKYQTKPGAVDLCVERLEDPPDEGDEIFFLVPLSVAMRPRLLAGPDGPGVAFTTPRGDWLLEYAQAPRAKATLYELGRHLYALRYPNDRAPTQHQLDNFLVGLAQSEPTTTNAGNTPQAKTQSTLPPLSNANVPSPQASPYKPPSSSTNTSSSKHQQRLPSPPRFEPQAQAQLPGTEVLSATGAFSVRSGQEKLAVGADVKIALIEADGKAFVALQDDGRVIHSWPLSQDVSLRYDSPNRSILWVSEMANHERGLFEFTFLSLKSYFDFQRELVARSYAAKSASMKASVASEDLDWMLDGLANQVQQISLVDEDDASEDSTDEEYTAEEAREAARRMQDEPESPFKSFLAKQHTPSKQRSGVTISNSPRAEKNSLLSVGRSSDRSFVVRGSHVGVFSPSSQGKGLRYDAAFDVQSPNKKTAFSPCKSMLHKQDEKLLLLHPEEKNKIFCVDLERGKVVEEWDTEGLKINSILPETKDAQAQGRHSFLGVNNNGFFIVDPRENRKVVRNHQYTNFKTTHFRCGASTQRGDLVVGTGLGEIRLFDQKAVSKTGDAGPRAKTKLVGYGDPILAVDVTRDGKYILATCATYLILCHVEDEDTGATGFEKSVRRPPILLQLKPEDVVLVGGKVDFTPAKFNVHGEETKIVTSTANWVILWDFSNLLQAGQNKTIVYEKRYYPDTVVADDFTRNSEGEVVLTMPDDVRLYHSHSFASPAKHTPTKK